MQSDEPTATLIKWCKERSGIRLLTRYVSEWHKTRSTPISDLESAYRDLVSDFLKKDLKVTSESVIPNIFGILPTDTFPIGHFRQGVGVVLQIQDTIDIGYSTVSLLKPLEALNFIKHRDKAIKDLELPRGMLRWTLSDGFKQIQAMEMEPIPDISLKTPFGTKILINNCQVKRDMLLLTKDSVKVLGGDVRAAYEKDMMAELEKRFKMKLGVSDEPEPLPFPGTQGNSATPNRPPVAKNPPKRGFPAYDNYLSGRTYVDSNVTPESLVNEIEDYGDDDMDYDAIEEPHGPETSNQQSLPTQNDVIDVFDDDDDFMELPSYKSPVRSSPLRPSLSKSLNKKSTQAKTTVEPQQPTHHTPKPSTSTSNNQTRNAQSNNIPEARQEAQQATQKEPDDNGDEDLSWLDPSVWENLNQQKDMDMAVDDDGKARCSFETLKKTLKAMEKGEYFGTLPDIVITRAKCKNLARFKMYPSLTFSLEMILVDPENEGAGSVKVYLNHEALVKLIGVEREELVDLNKKNGPKAVINQVFKPFWQKVVTKTADIEIDLTVLESEASHNVDSKAFLPLVKKFDICE